MKTRKNLAKALASIDEDAESNQVDKHDSDLEVGNELGIAKRLALKKQKDSKVLLAKMEKRNQFFRSMTQQPDGGGFRMNRFG